MNRKRWRIWGAAGLALIATASVTREAQGHTRITTDVTWGEYVRPIFIRKCMPCHHPGGAAPDYVNLTYYGTDTDPGARAWAVAIEEEILTDRMPPWKADKRFGEFHNARRLTQEETDLIVAWVNGGAPQGPLRNLPVPEQFLRTTWEFGAPDLVVAMPQGHVVPADQQYDEAAVRAPVEIQEDVYITGFEFLVENAKNVARVAAWIHDPEGLEPPPIEVEVQTEYDPLADEDAAEETRMRPMPKGPHFLGQWVKGDGPVLFPDAAGRLLRKGSQIELRVDYFRPTWADWSEPIRDNTQLGLFLAAPDEEIDLLVESGSVANPNFTLKAGEKTELTAEYVFSENVHLIGLHPHLGPIGTRVRADLEYPDGFRKTLLWAPGYAQRWTSSFWMEQPVPAPAGTKLTLTGSFDNSADNWDNPNDPPKDLEAGPGYLDEQLYAAIDYTLDDHLKVQAVIVAKAEAPRDGGGMLGSFNAGDPKQVGDVETPIKEVIEALDIPQPPERIREAANGYHQVQGMMVEPGAFSFFVYDDAMQPLDPRNFRGELTTSTGESLTLTQYAPSDDQLSAWLTPEFPQTFDVAINLAGKIEHFPFTFEKLSVREGSAVSPAPRTGFIPAPHGGWLETIETTGHHVEATLETPGDLRLYFYDAGMGKIDPRNFTGDVAAIDPDTGKENGATYRLSQPDTHTEYLEAEVPTELPLTLEARLWIGSKQQPITFEFDELTEEPWDFGQEAKPERPLIVGPHGSPEFHAAANGFHFVEGTMPRPGEFHVYFYDGWKNPVDAALFTGTITVDGATRDLTRFHAGDDYLSAYFAPEFPVDVNARLWITGNQEAFSFHFEDATFDASAQADTAMAHMDHEPLHGGTFFMADDMFHHLEGAMPSPGEFRMYFYDNQKLPIDPRNFAGTVYIEKQSSDTGEVIEEIYELAYDRPGDPFLVAELPYNVPVTLYTMVDLGGEKKRFDFAFDALTVDTGRSRIAAATAATAGAQAAAGAGHEHIRIPFNMPDTVPEMLSLIDNRAGELDGRIARKTWTTLYQPSLDIKEIVEALSRRSEGLGVRDKGRMKLLVGAVNRTVNKMDRAGDSADAPRVQAVRDELFGHLDEIRKIYSAKA